MHTKLGASDIATVTENNLVQKWPLGDKLEPSSTNHVRRRRLQDHWPFDHDLVVGS